MSLWGSHVPPVPLGCPSSLWGGSQVSFGVPCPFGGILCPLLSLWGVPHPFRGVPCPFGGPMSPPVPLGCPSSLWGGSMSLWGSHVPSFPFGVSPIPLGRGPTSPPITQIPSVGLHPPPPMNPPNKFPCPPMASPPPFGVNPTSPGISGGSLWGGGEEGTGTDVTAVPSVPPVPRTQPAWSSLSASELWGRGLLGG